MTESFTGSIFGWEALFVAGVSFVTCGVILLLAKVFPLLAGHHERLGDVQALHVRVTPRIGGVAIFAAAFLSLAFAPDVVSVSYGKFLAAASLLFFVGLAEDLGFGVRPIGRLLAAFAASLLVVLLLGVWLSRADIPGLDAILDTWVVGVPLTLLITGAITNGFNLIDGVNGLAGLTSAVAALALAMIAREAGYLPMVHLATMLAAGVIGYLVWNYPFGLIFLGDAGAYTLGFVLSWFSIAIVRNAPDVTPWALLLVLFWPVADLTLAIWRRAQRKAPAMAPDRLHVHQLVLRILESRVLGRNRRHIANPLTTLVLAPFVIAPPMVGVWLWNEPLAAFIAVLVISAMFFGGYVAAIPVLRWLSHRGGEPVASVVAER